MAEGLKSIPIPAKNTVVTCDANNILILAPWLKNAISEEDSNCPFKIILATRQAYGDFVQNHCGEDEDLKEEIKNHFEGFTSWAWAVGHCKVESLKMLVHPDNGEISAHLISTQGQTQSINKILKSSKRTVTVPTKYHELGNQIAYFKGAVKIFFGVNAKLAAGLENLIMDLETN